MRHTFTLRRKFLVLNLFLLTVVGLLIYVVNIPYREMRALMNDVRYDIVQIMEAEKFVRTIYEQQHEVAKLIVDNRSGRTEFDRLGSRAGEILGKWRAAFMTAEFSPEKSAEMNGYLIGVTDTTKLISDLSGRAVLSAAEGDAVGAVRLMDMADDRIMQDLLPQADKIIKVLETEVDEDLPLLFRSLQQTAVVPLFRTDIHLKEMSHELEHALQIQKISRFFSSQYLDILRVIAGSSSAVEIGHIADFRRRILGMLDSWTKESSEEREAEEKREDEMEISTISSMMPLLDRIERAGIEASGLARRRDGSEVFSRLNKELNEIDGVLASKFDMLVANEEDEIDKRIDSIVRVVDRAMSAIFIVNVIIALTGMFIIWFVFSKMVSPILQLRNAFVKISGGDFSTAVSPSSGDEIGDLAESFEEMRLNLIRAIDELKGEIVSRKSAEAEKEHVITELQEAMGKIKTLSGLIPICASCKKIRDDRGFWNQIESYISEHSDAEFTHGYCPECAAKFRAEIELLKNA